MDLSAYRTVQEALTNVVKHAGTPTSRVVIGHGRDELSIEVIDGGRAGSGGRGGHGLVGMRERVDLFGGRFSAGPGPDGGFRVAVRLPLPTTVAGDPA